MDVEADQHREHITLAAQLSNRNILTIDLWNQVFSQDKKDDIDLKLRQHEITM